MCFVNCQISCKDIGEDYLQNACYVAVINIEHSVVCIFLFSECSEL